MMDAILRRWFPHHERVQKPRGSTNEESTFEEEDETEQAEELSSAEGDETQTSPMSSSVEDV